LFKTRSAIAVVPGNLKANAIYNTLNKEISEQFPSTILRKHPDTTLYIDVNSAEKIS
jgi:glucosamine-6-phosphate deaminase